ncbi:MAG TPA: hypothetical protein VM554_03975 [Acidisarcina sp.]|nr:hypothetical protein [Acidisarcina sp.]
MNVPGINPDGSALPVKYSSIDLGAIGSVAYYFNRFIGIQGEFGAHPDGRNDGIYTAQGGLIGRYPNASTGVTPFVHALAGGARIGGPLHEPYTWGPALTVGGGMDYDTPLFNHHLGLRLFQADYEYMHANFGPQAPVAPHYIFGGRANINAARLSTGLLYHFGNIVPPPPVTYSCAVSPNSVFPGDPATVTGTAANLNPKKTAKYSWTATGVKVTGDTATGNIDTAGVAPGTYTIKGNVSEGVKAGQFADCSTDLTVKQFEPPTVSCSANPSTIKPGDSSTITAQGVSPQNRTLTYSYTTSAGQISGAGNTATLTTTGAPAGAITVTCNVVDDKGQTASSTTNVNVEAPPPPPVAKTQTLCSINFDRDKKRPARVDNEAKACLDDVALNLQRQSDATAVLVGNKATEAAPKKGKKRVKVSDLAAQRAVNTKNYLVTEKGIDPSRISVQTGTQDANQVQNYLVPAGATFSNDVQGTTPLDESTVKAQTRTAVKHKTHHKKAAK